MNPLAIPAIINGGIGLFQAIKGDSATKRGQEALNAFDRQELENVYEGLSLSTYGSDLLKEENARGAATAYDAARSGGIRGIMSSLPKIQAQTNRLNKEAATDLDQQAVRRDYAIAGDNVRIQRMQEQRDNAELAGIGQMIQNGKQDTMTGLRSISNSISSVASGMGGAEGAAINPKVQSVVGNLQAAGPNFNFSIPGSYSLPQATDGSYEDYLQQEANMRMYNEANPKTYGF